RDLSAGEIVCQALMVQRELDKQDNRLGNIVVMGTGEPFDNYDNVMKAMSIINDPYGLEIGSRHISISTCGLVPGIKRFAREGLQYNLAISLHAPNNELRDTLMPINKAYPLEVLFEALREYTTLSNRRLTFEYLLLKGINDSIKEANQIKDLLKGMNAYINLIPYNKVDEKDYETSSDENALRFYDLLKKNNVAVTLRQKKGDDIDAACGQLRAKNIK
ncbi:MAG: radical SAM protein, partial [Erysipelotrichaceae bacterium]|nr:radical SAM protein [Erysipelotrichaceae bacterium]